MSNNLIKVVVTGGCGFIGSHMVELLLQHNYHVTVIDNLSTGRISNLEKVKKNKNLVIIEEDIRYFKNLNLFNNISYVYHFAGKGDIVPSIDNPTEYFETNANGTLNMLEHAKTSKYFKRFVYAASSSCYGIAQTPTSESHPINNEHPYALSKYAGEIILRNWGKIYDLPFTSIRIFNAYGPRVRTTGVYGAVFGVFFKQKLEGHPLTVVGDGSQTRDFLYVEDVCNAFYMSANSEKSKNQIYNLGYGDPVSINKLVEILNSKKVHIPDRPGEPKSTHADISKISSEIGWSPKITFEEGVNKMLNEIENWKDAPLWTPDKIEKVTENWFKFLKK